MARTPQRSTRRCALRRFSPDWRQRHEQRLNIANKPGCRAYAIHQAAQLNLALTITADGARWVFRSRTQAYAVWRPFDASLQFQCGVDVHCHEVFQVIHEIRSQIMSDVATDEATRSAKDVPPQTVVLTRGRQTTCKVTAAGDSTIRRFRTLCDELTSNSAVSQRIRELAKIADDAADELNIALRLSSVSEPAA